MTGGPPGEVGALSRRGFLTTTAGLVLAGVAAVPATAAGPAVSAGARLPTRAEIIDEFAGRRPGRFGMVLPGMVRRGRERVALTFDACGGSRGSGYDKAVIATLR